MDSLIPASSGLPNLHPALVHFPLALAPAALLFDLLLLFAPRRSWLDRAATALWCLAAGGAFAAVRAGEAARAALAPLAPEVRSLLREHDRLGTNSLWTLAVIAVVRGLLTWRDLRIDVVPRDFLRFVLLAAGAGGLVLLAATADHGGRLVYQHAVAVTPQAAPVTPAAAPPPGETPGAG
ncbi:MAG TPA: DUF2231 domain-containing protein [Dongiaceae bacterium]|nr:DUF2231 domain-containing protein [Dongiaceae bacterium]